MKPSLLVVELWGLGDLVIATPFIQAATEHFEVTLLCKPYGKDLQARFWPEVKVVPFVAPWTAFEHKYRLWRWPWSEIFQLRKSLKAQSFDFGLSARWDPRDHFVLYVAGARERMGFPRIGSQLFLTRRLSRPDPKSHRYEHWRAAAKELGFTLPSEGRVSPGIAHPGAGILIHTGAAQPVRVWALDRYLQLVKRLRAKNYYVQVACDADQRAWWLGQGEQGLAVPATVPELFELVDRAAVFIGNDSGPGHLAAFCGLPTFTIFGPQLANWFMPLNPFSEFIQGRPCPFKPCSDYCDFPEPYCLSRLTEAEVWARIEVFVARTIGAQSGIRS